MRGIKSIYTIGNGPSSSHTVGPYNAAKQIKKRYQDADYFEVTLYGSLAFTGAGHGTMKAINEVLPNAVITSDIKKEDLPHPNTMLFVAYKDNKEIGREIITSVGGGTIEIIGEKNTDKEVYKEKNLSQIIKTCKKNNLTLAEYAYLKEGDDLKNYLYEVWEAMKACIQRGLNTTGILPGGLNISRKAQLIFNSSNDNETDDLKMDRLISAFSYAVCEENNDGHVVVTAPTCGSCGVIPSILYYMKEYKNYKDEEIIDALATGAMIGNVIRTNASISGAECGCQAEIGSACSMAAAALASLYKMNIDQIEYASEVAMEHNLGLTCDPVKGLVQIPCIERNAVGATRAISSVNLARFLYQTRKISFDEVVETMYKTGLDMSNKYKETSHGGLAAIYSEEKE